MLITYGSICSPLRTYNELNGVGEEKLEEELMGIHQKVPQEELQALI